MKRPDQLAWLGRVVLLRTSTRTLGRMLKKIVGQFLWITGLGRAMVVHRNYYSIYFSRSSFSYALWLDPSLRRVEEAVATAVVKEGDTVVDVGGNIGTFALTASALVGQSGRILTFEPDQRIFNYLVNNLELNAVTNVYAYNWALAARSGEVNFLRRRVDSMSSIIPNAADNHKPSSPFRHGEGKKVRVKVSTADLSVMGGNLGDIRLLKIDTEGAEALVLEGATQVLGRTHCILIEVDSRRLASFGSDPSVVYSILRQQGFIAKLVHWKDGRPRSTGTCDGDWFCYRSGKNSLTNSDVLVTVDLPYFDHESFGSCS